MMNLNDFEHLECVHQDWHMQGFSKSENHMYWSFTNSLVKTSLNSTVICQKRITGVHLGDIDYHDGKVYASYLGLPLPGHEWGDWESFGIYVFDAENLELIEKLELDECMKMKKVARTENDTLGFRGIDGVAIAPAPEDGVNRLYIACATWPNEKYRNNLILRFDMEGNFEKRYLVPTGNTMLGIQNLDYDAENREFWFTTYSASEPYQTKETLFCVPLSDPTKVSRSYRFSTPCGIECLGKAGFFASIQFGKNGNQGGIAYRVAEDFFRNECSSDKALFGKIAGD